ncbi:hypothetical protein [Stakelama marina]|uniref:Transporter n=1 Tax=Stakelama marina TaxID=2826939 RepID=A0A8T4IDE3_9SPHN|nr:hypothetical protein [Stakelama marina]MBR0552421.1 hypothetical protein [Stakelama marina]
MRNAIAVMVMMCGTGLATTAAAQTADRPSDAPASANGTSTHVEFDAGAFYQSGDYGTGEQIETWSMPFSVTAQRGRLRLSASLPYLVTNAPGDVIVNSGGPFGLPLFSSSQTQTTRMHREGLGDLVVAGDYTLPVSGVQAVVGASVKLPTASVEKGLGTGKTDYSIRGGLAKPIGRVTPFVDVAYNFIGQPKAYSTQDGVSASAGARFRLSRHLVTTAAYDYSRGAVEGFGDRQSVRLGLNASLGDHLGLGVYGSKGVSRAAADTGAGLQLGLGF